MANENEPRVKSWKTVAALAVIGAVAVALAAFGINPLEVLK